MFCAMTDAHTHIWKLLWTWQQVDEDKTQYEHYFSVELLTNTKLEIITIYHD